MEFNDWSKAVQANITSLSRTAAGKADRTTSRYKPMLLIEEGPALAAKAAENLHHAVQYAWSQDLPNPGHFHGFAETIARMMSKGILPEEVSMYRTWSPEGKYQHWPKPHALESDWSMYCDRFDKQRCLGNFKAHVLAADLELTVDLDIHPFADGCGRSGKLLSSWVLLRAGLMPPLLTSRTQYYEAMNSSFVVWIEYYEKCMKLREAASA